LTSDLIARRLLSVTAQETSSTESPSNAWRDFTERCAAYGSIHNCRDASVLFSNYPEEISLLYERDFGGRRDPIMRAAMRTSFPVRLGEYRRANACSPSFLRLMAALSDIGVKDGLGIFVTPRPGDFIYISLGFEHSLDGWSEKMIGRIQHRAEMTARKLFAGNRASIVKRLTSREIEVLCLFSTGRSDKEIARELGLAPCSVRTLAERCAEKLNVTSRIESAIEANRLGIIPHSGPCGRCICPHIALHES